MVLTINENGTFSADNCNICYKNFSGIGGKYNREGDRNFGLVIHDEEQAMKLRDIGYNVKQKESEDGPWWVLTIKVKFSQFGPDCFIKKNRNMTKLDETTIGLLDNMALENIDMDVRPFKYDMNGGGISAYLSGMCVSQKITSRFAQMASNYADETITDSNECPFE